MPDPVQPDEGQGGEATTGLFDSYLQAVPEEHRETVTGYLKDAEKNVNSRLEKAAELEKNLGPYQQVEALNQYDPGQLNELLAWHQQVTASDEAFQQWLAQAAGEAGFTKAETEQLEDAESEGVLSQERIEQLVADRAAQQVQPLEERLSAWEKDQQVTAVETEINSEFSRLEKEHKLSLDDDQRAEIMDLGIGHEGDGSWVQFGFDRYRKIGAASQAAFVTDKAGQPGSPLSAGATEAFKPATTFDEARKQLTERLRQNS